MTHRKPITEARWALEKRAAEAMAAWRSSLSPIDRGRLDGEPQSNWAKNGGVVIAPPVIHGSQARKRLRLKQQREARLAAQLEAYNHSHAPQLRKGRNKP
jgi:hypothetical protein